MTRRLVLVSYFYSPLHNAGARRWTRIVERLLGLDQELKLSVFSGFWELKNTAGENAVQGPTPAPKPPEHPRLKVHAIRDSVSQDAQGYLKREEPVSPSAARRVRTPWQRLWRQIGFLFIDGKFLWSTKVFFQLLRGPHALDRSVDHVVVTGTPWSALPWTALACRLKGVPYFVDFRDLWSQEPHLPFSSSWARRYFSFWERIVCRHAKGLIGVNEPLCQFLESLVADLPSNIRPPVVFLPNGLDEPVSWSRDSFRSVLPKSPTPLLYAGSVSPYHGLSDVIGAINLPKDLPLTVLGQDHVGISTRYPSVQLREPLHPDEAQKAMANAQVLFMTLDPKSAHYTTTKLMTYISAGRPILYVGPENAPAACLIRDLGLGWVHSISTLEDVTQLQRRLEEISRAINTGGPFSLEPLPILANQLTLGSHLPKLIQWIKSPTRR